MGGSLLHYDLCFNVHVRDDPSCRCGARFERVLHYFMQCALFDAQRERLLESVNLYQPCTLPLLLYGDSALSDNDNRNVFFLLTSITSNENTKHSHLYQVFVHGPLMKRLSREP